MYFGEIPSKVMRYSNGEVSEAPGYYWSREEGPIGQLFLIDSSGNNIPNPSTGSYRTAQEYKTFAVFACNPLLPLIVTGTDPLVYHTSDWELLRIFHPRNQIGLSQVVTLESPMGEGPAPVRYVAGKNPSWMPALIPTTYKSPHADDPESGGLGDPDSAQEEPNGFLSIVFLDPENPNSTEESLRLFEWQTAIVRESGTR
ncbi:hypothetical protein CDV36_004483 [Fusarium kuroshium]|uniref:Uncharacterized protein n=1 Tax=Fusarium kuroshium TaxID=2010991 RepID=A0A3M2SE33_9HYPO|nr:hypothetical protein CDV36_004483 [Fusarium kuroshium]